MDDRELVKQAREGSHAAFHGLVQRYQQKVYAMALSMVRDPDQAQDVAQEAFVKAYEHLDHFQGDSAFYTWLYRIVMNLCIDRVRRARRFTHVEFDEAIDPADGGVFDMMPQRLAFDPDRALRDQEIRQRITTALDELSPTHRAVLVLRELDGLAYKEIAEVMNCSVGTVMSRLFHARKRMQQLLRGLVDEPAREAADGVAAAPEEAGERHLGELQASFVVTSAESAAPSTATAHRSRAKVN